MKKICIVAEYMFCGGSEKSLLAFLHHLKRSDFNITLLLMKKRGDLLPLLPKDIQVEEIVLPNDEQIELLQGRGIALKTAIRHGKLVAAVKKSIRGIKMTKAAKTAAERRLWYYQNIEDKIASYPENFDVVIDYMGYGLFNTFYAAKKVPGKVKITWVHFEPMLAMPDFTAFHNILIDFDHIMCVSENSMKQVSELMPDLQSKCHVFHNLIDEDSIREQAKEIRIQNNPEETTVLSVGRLDSPKGFDIAVRVFSRLHQEGYPVKLQIIGTGWQQASLEAQIEADADAKSCVQLLGQKINPYPYFEACDIYIQPSRHEGYGIAVAEARFFNKPIITTNFAGARAQLKDNVTGLIVKCDEENLYNGLKKLLDHPDLQEKFRENLAKEHGEEQEQMQLFYSIISEEKEG